MKETTSIEMLNETASIRERANYVADMTAQLADMIADIPDLCLRLRTIALEATIIAIRKSET